MDLPDLLEMPGGRLRETAAQAGEKIEPPEKGQNRLKSGTKRIRVSFRFSMRPPEQEDISLEV
jgi:hypothetical protein